MRAKDLELQKLTSALYRDAHTDTVPTGLDSLQCSKALSASSSMKASVARLVQRLDDMARLASIAGHSDLTVALAKARAEAGDLQATLGTLTEEPSKTRDASIPHVFMAFCRDI
eukprot:3892691-Amphidinium_carterae.1